MNYTKENLQKEFVKKMLHRKNFESVMQEDTDFYKEHNKLVEKKKVSISIFTKARIFFFNTRRKLMLLEFILYIECYLKTFFLTF